MKLDPEEAIQLTAEIRELVPGFEELEDKTLVALIGGSLVEITKMARDVEHRIEEAGVVPADLASVLMIYGGFTQVAEELPDGTWQRQLIAAGRAIGKLIARKFGEKIREQLEAKRKKETH